MAGQSKADPKETDWPWGYWKDLGCFLKHLFCFCVLRLGICYLIVSSCGIGAMGGLTHVNFLSGPALEDFLQSLDPHHRSLTSPIHADGQQWEVGKREGVVKSAVFYCWSRRRSLLDNILVVS